MNLDFTKKGKVKIEMKPYVEDMINSFPKHITKAAPTPVADHLFQT